MEKVKLYLKITLSLTAIIVSVVVVSVLMALSDVQWKSVGVLIAVWWLSFIGIFAAIFNVRDIIGFVSRAIQFQRSLPKGASSSRLQLMILVTITTGIAVYYYRHLLVAVVQYGSNSDRLTAFFITVALVATAKTYGYHRFDTKRAKKVSQEPGSAKVRNVGLSILDGEFKPAG